jgi:predicted aldo/keto reductase-like oxidoreductase
MVSKVAMGGIPIMRLDKIGAVKVVRDVINMGINFIDTANAYGDSEEKIGEAIRNYNREDIVLSSKSGARDKNTFAEHLDLSLKRLGTDYIDIYHLHGVSNEENLEKVMADDGAYQALDDAVRKGKVRHHAFSSHNIDIADKMLNTRRFQVTQIPLNFIDSEAESLLPLAKKLDIGFIAMKPLGGGLLDDAVLAFKYLSQFDNVVPDPGIEKTGEMQQIVKILENPGILTDKDNKRIEALKKEMGSSWCHRCDYCQPCPQDIPISNVLLTKSMLKRLDHERAVIWCGSGIEKARECIECRDCVERCPYDLDIPELLIDNIKIWEEYLDSRK